MEITDGRGTSEGAKVGKEGHFHTLATTREEAQDVNVRDRLAFSWQNDSTDPGAAGATILLVKNTSQTYKLHITDIWANSIEATQIKIHTTDMTGIDPAGVAVSAVCANTSNAVAPDATAKSEETANTIGDIHKWLQLTAAAESKRIPLPEHIILDKNIAIGVDAVADISGALVTIEGYFTKEEL